MILAAVIVIAASSCFLFAYGTNLIYLSLRAARMPRLAEAAPVSGEEPTVAVQLPIYNERYVAQRVIDAAAGLDWPRDRVEVQVLDDSDDETRDIVDRRVAQWRRRALAISSSQSWMIHGESGWRFIAAEISPTSRAVGRRVGSATLAAAILRHSPKTRCSSSSTNRSSLEEKLA